MSKTEISDKALIKNYLELKNMSRREFCNLIGVSKSFLDLDSGIGVDTLRVIISTPELDDFNLTAFLRRDAENMVKEKGQLSDTFANQRVLIDAVKKAAELKSTKGTISQEDAKALVKFIDVLVEMFLKLSEDYQEVYKSQQKLMSILEKEANIKKP